MAQLGRGEPRDFAEEDSEVIDRIVSIVNILLPRGKEAAVLRGVNKIIASAIGARERYNDSLLTDSPSDDVPVPLGLLGSGASLRMRVSLHQQPGGKRVIITDGIAKVAKPTDEDGCHVQNDRPGSGNPDRQPAYREDSDSANDADNSSDWTEDSDPDDARTSRSAARHSARTPKQRQRGLPSRMFRRSIRTVIQPAPTPSSQVQTANHGAVTRPGTGCRIIHMHVCSKCPQKKETRWKLEEHMARHGAGGKHKCATCDFATDNGASYYHHKRIHPEPSQVTQPREKRHRKRRSPSESESEVSPARALSVKRIRDNGHFAVPLMSQGGRYSAGDGRAAVGPGKRAHPFSPGESSSGHSDKGAETDQQRMTDFRCKFCPEVFVYKAHLKLHRRLNHPTRYRHLIDCPT